MKLKRDIQKNKEFKEYFDKFFLNQNTFTMSDMKAAYLYGHDSRDTEIYSMREDIVYCYVKLKGILEKDSRVLATLENKLKKL